MSTPAAKADERELYVVEYQLRKQSTWHADAVDAYNKREDAERHVDDFSRVTRYVPEDALLRAKLDVLEQLDEYARCLSEARRGCQSPYGDEYEDAVNRLTEEYRRQLSATDSGTEGTL